MRLNVSLSPLSDVRAILLLDPYHCEARQLLALISGKNWVGTGNVSLNWLGHIDRSWGFFPNLKTDSMLQASSCHTLRQPYFSYEIWWEIASFLPRRDLRSLVSVPHALSSIARQLLFRDVSLQLGSFESDEQHPVETEKWHARRSAKILCHLVSHPARASQVRSLTVYATNDTGDYLSSYFIGVPTLSVEFQLS